MLDLVFFVQSDDDGDDDLNCKGFNPCQNPFSFSINFQKSKNILSVLACDCKKTDSKLKKYSFLIPFAGSKPVDDQQINNDTVSLIQNDLENLPFWEEIKFCGIVTMFLLVNFKFNRYSMLKKHRSTYWIDNGFG